MTTCDHIKFEFYPHTTNQNARKNTINFSTLILSFKYWVGSWKSLFK